MARGIATRLAVLGLFLVFPCRSYAVTYTLIGDGTAQLLTWRWEFGAQTCMTCGNQSSVNGRIPLNYGPVAGGAFFAGGMLDWSESGDSLKVVALTRVKSNSTSSSSRLDCWAALDIGARAPMAPLLYRVHGDIGGPLDLKIVPRIVGLYEQSTNPGGVSELQLELMMAVKVNGQLVSRDSLYKHDVLSDGADVPLQPLSFPKGAANDIVLFDVPTGSDIEITLWGYMRAIATGVASIISFGPYGDGPAIEIVVHPVGIVDVPPQGGQAELTLRALPNPSRGTTRIDYTLPRTTDVRLSIYDLRGARVATLVNGTEDAGRHEVTWRSGSEALAPGVYLMELRAGGKRRVGKLVLTGR